MALPTMWTPPGCVELLRTGEEMRLAQREYLWPAPLADPEFGALCKAKRLRRARGSCYRHQQRVVCLPSFVVVGFTKSGTSVFFQYAAQHHLVRVAEVKEPAYLGADPAASLSKEVERRPDDEADEAEEEEEMGTTARSGVTKQLKWYVKLFPNCANCERGEATPGYAWRDNSAAAAAQARLLLGAQLRLVVLVREPIRRAVSHYLYFRRRRHRFRRVSNLSHALHEALDEFERCIAQLAGWHHQCTYRPGRRDVEVAAAAIARVRPELWRLRHGRTSYELLQGSLYSEHLRTWRAQFPARAILVLDAALLLDAPLRAMRRFEKHLSLPHHRNYSFSQVHALAGRAGGSVRPGVAVEAALKHDVDATLHSRLQAFFAPFNQRLERDYGIGWEV